MRRLLLVAVAYGLACPPAFAQQGPPPGQQADLVVTKTGPDQVAAGADASYDVTVFNSGPDTSGAVTLNDPIPAGMTFVSSVDDPGFTCSTPAVGAGGTITCTAADLAAGATASFTFVFNIPAGTPPGTFFTNIATATSAFDPNSENDSGIAVTSTPPPPQSNMLVTKDAPDSAGPDTDVVFTIGVGNAGPDDATGVSMDDTLPGTMTFVSVSVSGFGMTCSSPPVGSGGTVSCTTANYPAGAASTITLTAHVPAGTPSGTLFSNTATVSSTTSDPSTNNNSATTGVLVSAVDVSSTKTGVGTALAGTDIDYTITVTNGGPDVATSVELTDTLPTNTTFVSFIQDSGPTAFCSEPPVGSPGTVQCTWPTLAAAAPAQFTLTIHIGDTLSITNQAFTTSDSFDTNPGNNDSSATTVVTPVADLGVAKTGPASIAAGADISYAVTVSNNGPSTASNVALTDLVPANTTFVSADQESGPAFVCATPPVGGAGTISCTIAAFAPGLPASFTFVLHVAAATPAGTNIDNTAAVATTTSDPNAANDTSTSTATVSASSDADLEVAKTGPASAESGTNVSYDVTVTNNGPANANAVSLSDPLPANTTFVSALQTSGPTFTCATPAFGAPGTITCDLANLAAGGTASFTFVVNVNNGFVGPISNTATVTSASADPDPTNGSSTVPTTIVAGTPSVLEIPTLSPLAMALMVIAIAAAAAIALRR